MAEKNGEGFVVVYSHEYGVDAFCAETLVGARTAVYEVMAEWMRDELTAPEARELLALIEADDFEGSCSMWYDKKGESFEIKKIELEGVDEKYAQGLATALASVKAALENDDE